MSIQSVPCSGIYARPPYSIQCGSGETFAVIALGAYPNPIGVVAQVVPEAAFEIEVFGEVRGALELSESQLADASGQLFDVYVFDSSFLAYIQVLQQRLPISAMNIRTSDGRSCVFDRAVITTVEDAGTVGVTEASLSINSMGAELTAASFEVRDATGTVVETWTDLTVDSPDGDPTGKQDVQVVSTNYDASIHEIHCTNTTPTVAGPFITIPDNFFNQNQSS